MNTAKVADALTWEFVSSKPGLDGVRLEQIMVYYHADLDEGFSVGFDRKRVPDLENILHRVFNAYKFCWELADKQQREDLISRYLAEVEDAARHRDQPDRHPAMQLVMNVIWLVLAGKIPEDEYNGTQYMWGAGAEPPWMTEESKS